MLFKRGYSEDVEAPTTPVGEPARLSSPNFEPPDIEEPQNVAMGPPLAVPTFEPTALVEEPQNVARASPHRGAGAEGRKCR